MAFLIPPPVTAPTLASSQTIYHSFSPPHVLSLTHIQVADLRDEHQKASIESHMRFWKEVQHAHRNRQEKYLRMTPELGPAPYTPTFPHSGEPVTDVTEMINYASGELRRVFGSTDLSFPPSTSSPP